MGLGVNMTLDELPSRSPVAWAVNWVTMNESQEGVGVTYVEDDRRVYNIVPLQKAL